MLIRYNQIEKRNKPGVRGKLAKSAGAISKLESNSKPGSGRASRKVLRVCPAKRPPAVPLARAPGSGRRPVQRLPPDGHDDAAMDPCDNSNDSGLGLEHGAQELSVSPSSSSSASLDNIVDQDTRDSNDSQPQIKRSRLSVKSEHEDEVEESRNDNFRFSMPLRELKGGPAPSVPRLPLSGAVCASTRDGLVTLSITTQPEQQHRARYQTEGSRGAVKDRSGNGFPIVKLTGYNKPAVLQVFIGSDVDRISPHMFYQACRVCGKNSTPCTEQKVDGTVVIELQFEPARNMIVTCDCVGILKERNVDVEHRFPDETVLRSKKKSTRCRMVFRTSVERPDGTVEMLQVVSQPIACTQLPGVPEICKKSLNSSPCSGGAELFILGKNFLKDSRVVFQQPLPSPSSKSSFVWEEEVLPDKEFLQPTHLVCVIPPFHRQDVSEPVTIRLFVRSSGKCSEHQTFQYLPNATSPLGAMLSCKLRHHSLGQQQKPVVAALPQSNVAEQNVASKISPPSGKIEERRIPKLILPTLLASQQRKPAALPPTASVVMVSSTAVRDTAKVKTEIINRSETQGNASNQQQARIMDILVRQFVSDNTTSPLPAQSGSSVEKFLSNIENEDEHKFHGNNEAMVTSTSLEFPQGKRLLSPIINSNNSILQPPSIQANNISSLATPMVENILLKNNDDKASSMILNVMETKQKISDIQVGTSINLQEISTTVPDQLISNVDMLVPSVIEQVLLPPQPVCADSTVNKHEMARATSVLVDLHQPVMDILNNPLIPSTIMQDEITTATSNLFETNKTQLNSQLLNGTMPCISEPLVVPTSLINDETSILNSADTDNSMGLLHHRLVSSESSQFQQADTTLNTQVNATSNTLVNATSLLPQTNSLLPTLNHTELVSEMNTQLNQLLTSDMLPENSATLAADAVNGALVRDVLLGSVASAPLLTRTSDLGLNSEAGLKKSSGTESILPQELAHMSEKDLLSYINPGCFDNGEFLEPFHK